MVGSATIGGTVDERLTNSVGRGMEDVTGTANQWTIAVIEALVPSVSIVPTTSAGKLLACGNANQQSGRLTRSTHRQRGPEVNTDVPDEKKAFYFRIRSNW
jgi:hypothetical protein